mmetsp:Transcript_85950/g.105467  ORF Transcript_85950/g.105467 Transcript_85950/m.105467 type:complete len:102 (-) Transcript_85950:60-365(-)
MQTPFGPMGAGFPGRRRPTPKPENLSKFGKFYNKCGEYRRKYGVYINNIIYYGWIPFVIYKGLQHGTHKYIDDTNNGQPMPQSRKPRITDLIPIGGTHGLP